MNKSKWALVLITWMLLTSEAQAIVGNVTATVSPQQIPLGKSATVRITWTITGSMLFPTGPTTTITSNGGSIWGFETPLVTQVGTLTKTLSRSAPSAGYTVKITETVIIPASASYAAVKNDYTGLAVVRTFTDGESPTFTGPTTPPEIAIGGAGSASFNLGRQALYFDDGSARRVIDPDTNLHALTRISYSGSGLLQGVWELADPTSTAGQPLFRTLRTVRQFVATGGEVELRSPPLKTHRPGRYLVRFRIQEPTDFDALTIEYFVGAAAKPPVPTNISLHTPADGSVLSNEQAFRWQAEPQATAYRVEFYSKGLSTPRTHRQPGTHPAPELNTPPVSGALIPAKQTALTLSAMSEAHLKSGHSYWWRVVAIDAQGKALAQSPVREIRVP